MSQDVISCLANWHIVLGFHRQSPRAEEKWEESHHKSSVYPRASLKQSRERGKRNRYIKVFYIFSLQTFHISCFGASSRPVLYFFFSLKMEKIILYLLYFNLLVVMSVEQHFTITIPHVSESGRKDSTVDQLWKGSMHSISCKLAGPWTTALSGTSRVRVLR